MQVVEAHGARIPMIGLGTMTLKGDVCVQAVKTALQMGYRHLDTAWFYGNEKEVGEGMRQSGVRREDIFICTKVRETHLEPDKFRQSLGESLASLQLPYVDLLLIHWNNKDIPFKTSVGALCQAKKDGFARHVGVANFTTTMLDEAWAVTSEPLVCNQIEVHPFINQDKVLAASKKHGMAVVAYVPIARGKVPGAEVLEKIARAHGKSAAQVSLRYLVQLDCCSIPRTATPAHMKENLDVFDFKLSDAEMADLKKLNATNMRVVNPPHAPQWDAA
jgi:diketogulonate reductase-like aldo/keto reductase